MIFMLRASRPVGFHCLQPCFAKHFATLCLWKSVRPWQEKPLPASLKSKPHHFGLSSVHGKCCLVTKNGPFDGLPAHVFLDCCQHTVCLKSKIFVGWAWQAARLQMSEKRLGFFERVWVALSLKSQAFSRSPLPEWFIPGNLQSGFESLPCSFAASKNQQNRHFDLNFNTDAIQEGRMHESFNRPMGMFPARPFLTFNMAAENHWSQCATQWFWPNECFRFVLPAGKECPMVVLKMGWSWEQFFALGPGLRWIGCQRHIYPWPANVVNLGAIEDAKDCEPLHWPKLNSCSGSLISFPTEVVELAEDAN